MEVIYLLIPLSVFLVIVAGAAFWLALRGGQYEDMEGPAFGLIVDDDLPPSDVAADSNTLPPPEHLPNPR